MSTTDDFLARERERLTKFYDGWIRHLDENSDEGSIVPSVGGPRITKHAGSFYVDPLARAWPDPETPPDDLAALTREDAIPAAVEADLTERPPEPSDEDVQRALNFRSLDFYELVQVEWDQHSKGAIMRVGKDYSDDPDLEAQRFISTLADQARATYLFNLSIGGGVPPAKKMTIEEYAKRVARALNALWVYDD